MISGAPEDAIFALADALKYLDILDDDTTEDDVSWAAVHLAAQLHHLGYAVCATRESTPAGMRDLYLEMSGHLPSEVTARFEFAWPFVAITGGLLLGAKSAQLMDTEHGRGEW